jgi:hypothetical protein
MLFGNHTIPLALSICAHAAVAISKPTMNAAIVFTSQIKTTALLGVKFQLVSAYELARWFAFALVT